MGLEKYKRKRDFNITPEPAAEKKRGRTRQLKFVVQKHNASRLHYDFRLEHNGILLSWAVPKGPSYNLSDKRLAVQTEDHPYEYRKFEGLIPKGEYGGGEVIIWDRGTFYPEVDGQPVKDASEAEKVIAKGMREGKLSFVLSGEKLYGSWALVKMKRTEKEWLLLKHDDEYAGHSEDITAEEQSVVSGKTIADLQGKAFVSAISSNAASEKGKRQTSTKAASRRGKLRTVKRLVSKEHIDEVIEALSGKQEKLDLQVGESKVSFSNLNKVLWPGSGKQFPPLTKRDYARYLCQMSPILLHHLKDRPLTLIRYPNGVEGKHFFQKHWEHKVPEFVETVTYFSEHSNADDQFLLCNNLPTLMWLAQIADLELHTVHTRIDPEPEAHDMPKTFTGSLANINKSLLNYPDFMVLDLDPYLYSGKEAANAEPELHQKGFQKACELALALKDILDSLELKAFVKTSGKTGLHIFVPVVRNADNEELRAFAATLARHCLKEFPDEVSLEWSVKKRTGKVFFDYNMNARGKTLASIYSPRNSILGTVSTPVAWEELGEIYPTEFTIFSIPQRVKEVGDLWENILYEKNDLRKFLNKKSSAS